MKAWTDNKQKLPAKYSQLSQAQRAQVRQQYITQQSGKCMFCSAALDQPPTAAVRSKYINWSLFPPGFLRHPVHLQHNHNSDLTEGAVHALCNAVLWQYYGR